MGSDSRRRLIGYFQFCGKAFESTVGNFTQKLRPRLTRSRFFKGFHLLKDLLDSFAKGTLFYPSEAFDKPINQKSTSEVAVVKKSFAIKVGIIVFYFP